jgi:hypothetical protein
MSEPRRWTLTVDREGEIVDTHVRAQHFPHGYTDVDVMPVSEHETEMKWAKTTADVYLGQERHVRERTQEAFRAATEAVRAAGYEYDEGLGRPIGKMAAEIDRLREVEKAARDCLTALDYSRGAAVPSFDALRAALSEASDG